MERKEAVKVENFVGSPTFSSTTDHVQTSYPFVQGFDFVDDKSSLGFMELLGVQDFSPSLLDMIQVQIPSVHTPNVQVATEVVESPPEVLNQPATPNSSTISSASSEGLNDEPVNKGADNEAEEQGKTKKESKPKKTNQKRQREPRFAFMTKSEVDHLEDGPFPRSYYRCTTASCNVKKRVERSFSDPSVVVTTYEGQHTHPSPVMPRPNFTGSASDSGFSSPAAFAMPMQRTLSLYQQHQSQQQPPFPLVNSFSPLGLSYNGSTTNAASYLQQYEKRFYTRPGSAFLNDHGLLQDLVPPHMLKEE
ncbi:hypothetical protein OIU84_012297 [Salix udensis]|uniref:WRKY domain-containing protein n=1 Tax=Salix udensis TaxID=889485 RepID=A0AAD6JH59_9ROSI|nr:hypothetical protein OIU84_012297 [Salix udensis]